MLDSTSTSSRGFTHVSDVTVVSLSGYPDIFAQLHANLRQFEPGARKILVTSGDRFQGLEVPGWEVIQETEPFAFPCNANIGIKAAGQSDVVLMNDDAQFVESGSIDALREISYAYPEIGVLSPHVDGDADNLFQTDAASFPGGIAYCERRLCFICVYLKREVLNAVGEMDERFSGYGFDDQDYCLRLLLAGYRLAVTSDVTARHGYAESRCSSSFRRSLRDKFAAGREAETVFRRKWMHMEMASDVVRRYVRG